MKKIFFLSIILLNSILCFSNELIPMDSVSINTENTGKKPHERPAYTGNGRRVTLGVSFGMGMDWLNPQADELQRNGTIFGMKYGIPVDINFTEKDNYYFTTGVFFNHSGGKLKFKTIFEQENEQLLPTERRFRSIYITIPTGIKLKTPSMSNFVIATNFGLYHSLRLSANASDKYIENNEPKELKKYVYTDETALFREAAYIGLGLEYIIKEDFRVYLYAIYAHTFTNFFNPSKSKNLATGDKDRANLGNLEFQLGLSF